MDLESISRNLYNVGICFFWFSGLFRLKDIEYCQLQAFIQSHLFQISSCHSPTLATRYKLSLNIFIVSCSALFLNSALFQSWTTVRAWISTRLCQSSLSGQTAEVPGVGTACLFSFYPPKLLITSSLCTGYVSVCTYGPFKHAVLEKIRPAFSYQEDTCMRRELALY